MIQNSYGSEDWCNGILARLFPHSSRFFVLIGGGSPLRALFFSIPGPIHALPLRAGNSSFSALQIGQSGLNSNAPVAAARQSR
jgi:hypothetical protein